MTNFQNHLKIIFVKNHIDTAKIPSLSAECIRDFVAFVI